MSAESRADEDLTKMLAQAQRDNDLLAGVMRRVLRQGGDSENSEFYVELLTEGTLILDGKIFNLTPDETATIDRLMA